jgi:hypothetical protein
MDVLTDRYAIYNGDCIDVMRDIPSASIHFSIYSPPFAGLYVYSSNERDISNCTDYDQFFQHYAFVVRELARITLPGRMTAVHCAEVPRSNSGTDSLIDFPGDIVDVVTRAMEFQIGNGSGGTPDRLPVHPAGQA